MGRSDLMAIEQKHSEATVAYPSSPNADKGTGPICAYGLLRMLVHPDSGHTTWLFVSLLHVKYPVRAVPKEDTVARKGSGSVSWTSSAIISLLILSSICFHLAASS